MMSHFGTVYLVGAGPGDPGLITVNGLEALRKSDVVIYDRLAPSKLLAEARSDAELVSAGKSPASVSLTQSEINALLIQHARAGKTVCRLKGGDPFVFGRGGEEAIALADADVPFTVIPGVTSAIGAAAYAGIPVTHRGVASSVTIVTASEMHKPSAAKVDWNAIANTNGTIVVLMGASRVAEIASTLMSHGRHPDESVAAVERGTSDEQRSQFSTLADIAKVVEQSGLVAPLALIVGDVVKLHENIAWFDSRPLFGKRILVTRARSQASRLGSGLSKLGGIVVECPVIRSTAPEDTKPLDAALMNLERYEWVTFASPNGVNQTFDRLPQLSLDSRAFAGCKVAAVGPATVEALGNRGIVADLTPDTFTADGLVAAFESSGEIPSSAVVFRSDIGRETLPVGLMRLGAEVTEVVAYRTVLDNDSADLARKAFDDGIDIVTFTSSSTVKNLHHLLDGESSPINNCVVVCMGPVTASTAKSFGIRVDVFPEEQSIDGMIAAIRKHYGN